MKIDRTKLWARNFKFLSQYKEREGHTDVPLDFKVVIADSSESVHPKEMEDGGAKLGLWLTSIRKAWREGKLEAEKIEQLQTLGVANKSLSGDRWKEGLKLLEGFKAREGHVKVPKGHDESGFKLAAWVKRQIMDKDKLTEEQRESLEKLGVSMSIMTGETPSSHSNFHSHLQSLRGFQTREGHLDVPRDHVEPGKEGGSVKLGLWLATMKIRSRKGELSAERIAALKAVGVKLEPPSDGDDSAKARADLGGPPWQARQKGRQSKGEPDEAKGQGEGADYWYEKPKSNSPPSEEGRI